MARRSHMKIKFIKRYAAAIMAVSVLSMGIVTSAAESSAGSPAQNAYGDTDWVFPVPTGEQLPYDQYLSALMDVYYRNDSQAFVALGLGTAEDAALLYNTVIAAELDSLDIDSLLGINCPEELKNDLRALMIQLLGCARYAVTGCDLQPDGTYEITVIYEQVEFFKPAMELYTAVVKDLANTWLADPASFPSEEDMMIQLVAAFCSSMRACVENITYAEPAVTTVLLLPQNGTYIPDAEDIANLETLLFDIDAVTEFDI